MFFPKDNVQKFFDIQPELVQNISEKWDIYSRNRAREAGSK
jgi:hypothetical protein